VHKGPLDTCTRSRAYKRGSRLIGVFTFQKRVILLPNPAMMLRPSGRDDVPSEVTFNDRYFRISTITHEQYLLISLLKNVLNTLVMSPRVSPRRSKFCSMLKRTRIRLFCGDAANEYYLHCEFHFTCEFCLPNFATPRSCFSNLYIIDFTSSPPCVLPKPIEV
jgi:hypothetical protein